MRKTLDEAIEVAITTGPASGVRERLKREITNYLAGRVFWDKVWQGVCDLENEVRDKFEKKAEKRIRKIFWEAMK